MIAIAAAALLASCVVLPRADYIHEWQRAKAAVGWHERINRPDRVIACPFLATVTDPGPQFGFRHWGSVDYYGYLTRRGKMRLEEVVTVFVPEGGPELKTTLIHEFIHVLLVRLRHVEDPRGFVGDEEQYICDVLPEDCDG